MVVRVRYIPEDQRDERQDREHYEQLCERKSVIVSSRLSQ